MKDGKPTLVYRIAVSEAERPILERLMLRNPPEGPRLDAACLTSDDHAGLVALNVLLADEAEGAPVRQAMAIHRIRIKVLLAIEQSLRANRGDRWTASEGVGPGEPPDASLLYAEEALSVESGADDGAWEYRVRADTMLWAPDGTDPELFVVRIPASFQSIEAKQYFSYLAEALAERGLRSGLTGEQLMRSMEPAIGETEATNWAIGFEAPHCATPLDELRNAAWILTDWPSPLLSYLWRGALAEKGLLRVEPLTAERAEAAEGSLEELEPWWWAAKLADE